jgi:hypothetical protein
VPSPLVAATVQAAAGHGAATLVSARVAALVEGVLKAMLLKSLRIATAALLVAATVIAAAAVLVHESRKEAPGAARVFQLDDRGRGLAWSPDGKTLAVVTKVEKFFLGYKYNGKGSAIQLWDVAKGQVRKTLDRSTLGGLAFQQVVFSADSKTIAATVSQVIRKPNELLIRDVI